MTISILTYARRYPVVILKTTGDGRYPTMLTRGIFLASVILKIQATGHRQPSIDIVLPRYLEISHRDKKDLDNHQFPLVILFGSRLLIVGIIA